MEQLIEKMKLEELNYYLFEHNFWELQHCKKECENLSSCGQIFVTTSSYAKMHEYYDYFYGVLWGMYTVNYITESLREACIDELLEMMRF